jgi:hypothetical protein
MGVALAKALGAAILTCIDSREILGSMQTAGKPMDPEREWTADDEREVAAIIVRFLKATGFGSLAAALEFMKEHRGTVESATVEKAFVDAFGVKPLR